MATVVVTLSGVAERSSMGTLASVMIASVVSGTISETEPTRVVLPTPKPPAIRIFAEVVGWGFAPPRPYIVSPACSATPGTERRSKLRGQLLAHALHQHRHLVGHQADVAVRCRQHGDARTAGD